MTFDFLQKGDVVDVVTPGTACDHEENKQIKKFLKSIELEARIFLENEITLDKPANHEFPSFEAKQRFLQFKKAVESDSKIIWCARGGYGSVELVEFIKKMPKPKKQKIFIGFSDISSLNKILIEKWKWPVVCAPMLAQIVLNKVTNESIKAICDFIFGEKVELSYDLISLNKSAHKTIKKSQIVGGCISVLAGSFGTKNQIDWNNKILFLEDEGEDGERLDRYFYQILQIIKEQKKFPAAVVLGNFLEANPHGTPKAQNIEIAIQKFAKNLGKIPLYQEKSRCLGHSKNMMPLLLGSEVEIKKNLLLQKV
jgi:muramoyltetrapeptide carboxypeptidase